MSQSTVQQKSIYLIVLLLIAILSVQLYTMFNTTKNTIPETTATSTTQVEQTPIVQTTSQATTTNSLYAGITDDKFVAYATTVIDKRCPFYEPNGVAYRECLSDWVDGLRKTALVEENNEVNAYCEVFSKKYSDVISFEESELFTKCAIYMLK